MAAEREDSFDSLDLLDLDKDTAGHFHEHFEEKRLVGKGGQGKVVEAYHKISRKYYAVKKVPYSCGKLEEICAEVRVLASLKHPNVVRYYYSWLEHPADEGAFKKQYGGSFASEQELTSIKDSTSTDSEDVSMTKALGRMSTKKLTSPKEQKKYSILYIKMELCSSTLKAWISNQKSDMSESGIGERDLLVTSFLIQMLEGISYIHRQKVIHRDLKPENIFLDDNLNVKIGDFGLCKQILDNDDPAPSVSSGAGVQYALGEDTDHFTHQKFSPVGTLPYAAPEVCRGTDYDHQVDMYSLGVILLEISHPDQLDVAREITPEIDNICKGRISPRLKNKLAQKYLQRMLSTDPYERPTAIQMLDELTTSR